MSKAIREFRAITEEGDILVFRGKGSVNTFHTRQPVDGVPKALYPTIDVMQAHMLVSESTVISEASPSSDDEGSTLPSLHCDPQEL